MANQMTPAALAKELAAVSASLSAKGLSGAKRLELLRKQAELGDERDARAEDPRR